MPAPTPNINITNHNTTNGPSEPTGEDDGGGGESEPANDPNKTTLNSGSANLQIPNKPNPSSIASSKSPKSPKSPQRPQISVEITPATPGTPAGRSPAPSAVSQRPSAGPQSPHEAVQSWVKSQDAHHHQEDPTTSTSSKAAPLLQKRDSAPATPVTRNRRPSASSQKSDRDFPRPPSAAGSISGGEGGGGGKFSLKELLGGGPKLSRRNSASSKKSVSSGKAGSVKGGGSQKGGSTAGESAALESKYGVYGKLSVGKGATSVVKLAHRWDRTEDKLYAVKEFRPRRNKESQRDYVKKLTSEFCISSALRHQNVVETVDLMQDQDAKWCEVMEFCPGGDLYNAIRKGGMSPAEVECCFKQILTGVGYLHAQGVAHRDLKPENIFFDAKGQIKIGDFGASTVFRLPWETTIHKSSGLCGSEPYIAPEQFTQPNSYDARLVDVWACGIVYYCLHFQELPWSCAQLSDKTYSQYAQQCASPSLTIAGIPFLKSATAGVSTPHTPAPSTPVRQDSAGLVPTLGSLTINSPIAMTPIPGTPTTTPHANPLAVPSASQQTLLAQQSRSEREKEQQREAVARYPATILNLSPRACRPVLRRMLEPKPEFRVTVEDVLKHPWIMEIEVCTDPNVRPKHMHPAAIAAANAGGIVTDK